MDTQNTIQRELKFRAWVKNNKVGHELFTVVMISWIGKEVILSGKGGSIGLDDCVLMQYTGLKDKTGKEIYEGDIVRAGKILSVIEYSSGQFIGIDWQYYNDRNLEVIGNIYENKELLES